jgi:hypothetical protein
VSREGSILEEIDYDFTVISDVVYRVTPWYHPSLIPERQGLYQGLVQHGKTKVVEMFEFDGVGWRNLRTGRFTKLPFEWRGEYRGNMETYEESL